MRKILFKSVIFLALSVAVAKMTAQEVRVKSFEELENDLIARTNERLDLNDVPAAVVRIATPDAKNFTFEGNIIGDVIYSPGEAIVYMADQSKKLVIKSDLFGTLSYEFKSGLKKQVAYRLTLALIPATGNPHELATADNFQNRKNYEKILDKDLQKKALKEARKEAKQLEKEGFKTPVGKLPLAKQLENAWERQAEIDNEGNPFWYISSTRVVGANQSSASLQAVNMAKIDLAGQIQTRVAQMIEAKVANDDMGKDEAASLSNVVASSKSVISATLGRTVPLVEVYRVLPNRNVEVMVTLGYSLHEANRTAIQALRNNLAEKSGALAKELDKLGY